MTAAESRPPLLRLNSCHYNSYKCRLGEAIRICRDTLQHFFEASRVSIWVNVDPLEPADNFPYLDLTITYNNSDWVAMYHKPQKSWERWGMISKVLTKIWETARYCGMLYKLVTQMVLLYGSESWVVTGEMLKVFEGFYHRADRKIARMTACSAEDGEWEYPPVADVM